MIENVTEPTTTYLIERDCASWVLRKFGRQEVMVSGPTPESAKEQAFERVRQWAPCRIRVMGDDEECSHTPTVMARNLVERRRHVRMRDPWQSC
jgi:hypothetical protein